MTTTQSCAECGTRAEPGQSFCDSCGAVLSWTDRAGARTGSAGSATADGAGRDTNDPRANRVPAQGSSASDDPAARLDALSLRLDALAAGGSYDSVAAPTGQDPATADTAGGSTASHSSGGSTTAHLSGGSMASHPSGAATTPHPAGGVTTPHPSAGATTSHPSGGPTTHPAPDAPYGHPD
ncbi:hypothetical protein JHN63_46005, partial [Streptomyces sp. MBT65]|nr:hypothetical protein [Streptomyces sp. MBT65]